MGPMVNKDKNKYMPVLNSSPFPLTLKLEITDIKVLNFTSWTEFNASNDILTEIKKVYGICK